MSLLDALMNRELGIHSLPFNLEMRDIIEEEGGLPPTADINGTTRNCPFHGQPSVRRRFGYDLCKDCIENSQMMYELEAKWKDTKQDKKEARALREAERKRRFSHKNQLKHIEERIARRNLEVLERIAHPQPTNARKRKLERKGIYK